MTILTDPGPFRDGEISLVLSEIRQEDPEKGHVPAYDFQIIRLSDHAVVGGCNLRIGNNEALTYSGHIGYVVYPDYRGNHYAAKACSLLFELARKSGLTHLTITCTPENAASRRTCELAGCTFVGIFPVPQWHDMYKNGRTEICRYEISLLREEPQ